jgi:hypothetical protein
MNGKGAAGRVQANLPKPLETQLTVGTTVRYYLNGWRIGHLEEINGRLARIRPVGAYKRQGALVRHIEKPCQAIYYS